MIIKTINLYQKIKSATVLKDVNITLESGKIYGFVGENGSGKTMLFRTISGLMKHHSGQILCDDMELYKDINVIPNLGIVLENAGLYPEYTGFQNLKFLSKINHKITDEQIEKSIERVGLNPKDKRTFSKYSLGMKQRIILAQALMESPDVIMLDEPTNALDENGVNLIREIILEEKNRGALILIASHNKEDINYLADVVYEVKNGEVTKRND